MIAYENFTRCNCEEALLIKNEYYTAEYDLPNNIFIEKDLFIEYTCKKCGKLIYKTKKENNY